MTSGIQIRQLIFLYFLYVASCAPKKEFSTPTSPRNKGQSFFTYGWNAYLESLKKIKIPSLEIDPTCKIPYAEVFNKSQIDVRIVFGYKDTRPSRFVGDFFERTALVEELVATCDVPEKLTCGFARDPDDADIFTKTLTTATKTNVVKLTLSHASVGPDDQENRSSYLQKFQSQIAEKTFLSGLQLADAVFYVGHSRDGGGPDFEAPRLTQDGHVDYKSYAEQKKGIQKTLKAIESRPKTKPLLLGFMSCSSQEHFAQDIVKDHKYIGLLSSRVLIYYTDALENTLLGLNAFLRQDCEPEFSAALTTRSSHSKGINNEGFFARTLIRAKKPSKR